MSWFSPESEEEWEDCGKGQHVAEHGDSTGKTWWTRTVWGGLECEARGVPKGEARNETGTRLQQGSEASVLFGGQRSSTEEFWVGT